MTTENNADSIIDWKVALSFTGGDKSLLNELLEMFPEESAKHLEAIRVAIERGDGASVTRAAHTLKSSARLVGASALAERALEMETLGQSSSIEEAEARLPELQAQTSQVIVALKQGSP